MELKLSGYFSRRALLGGVAGLGAGIAFASGQGHAAGLQPRRPTKVLPDGTYETVPLAKDAFYLGVAQSRVVPVDLGNLKATRKANLDHMLDLICSPSAPMAQI